MIWRHRDGGRAAAWGPLLEFKWLVQFVLNSQPISTSAVGLIVAFGRRDVSFALLLATYFCLDCVHRVFKGTENFTFTVIR